MGFVSNAERRETAIVRRADALLVDILGRGYQLVAHFLCLFRNSIGYASLIVVQEISRDDLEIIAQCVRERTSAVTIAQCPDTRHVGAQLIVYQNEFMRICGDASLV